MGWASRARASGASLSAFEEATTREARVLDRLQQRTTLPERIGLLLRAFLAVRLLRVTQGRRRRHQTA